MMKKLLACVTSAAILFCTAAISASAAPAAEPGKSQAMQEMNITAKAYVEMMEGNSVSFENGKDLIPVFEAGVQSDEIKEGYLNSLKDALDANGGKLLYSGTESPAQYPIAIKNLTLLGESPESFFGHNLFDAMNNADLSLLASGNLYLNCIALSIVNEYNGKFDSDVEEAFKQSVMNKYLEADGKAGYDNWGISVDNNGYATSALAPYYGTDETVTAQLGKASEWTKTQGTAEGYGDGAYMFEPNSDSTAGALKVFAAVGDKDSAAETYAMLLKYKSDDNSGSYAYSLEDLTDKNLFATADVLGALSAYSKTLENKEESTTTPPETTAPPAPDTTAPVTQPVTEDKDENDTDIPKTGVSSVTSTAGILAAASFAVIVMSRKRREDA